MLRTSQLLPLFVATVAMAIVGCDNAQTDPSPSNLNASTEATANAAATDVDADLDAMARALALSIGESPNLTGTVVNGVSERFNGDTEIMWKDISERQVDGATFSATMSSSFAQADSKMSPSAAAESIDEIAARNPRLHIAVRGDVDAVGAEGSPLVAFAPESIDDLELERVKAYDSNGDVVWLDGQRQPDFPVIVVGLNERTDEHGNLLPKYSQFVPPDCNVPDPPPECGGGGGGGGGGGSNPDRESPHQLKLYSYKVIHDREGWPRGNPEINYRVGCQQIGNLATQDQLNEHQAEEGVRYYPNTFIFTWIPADAGNYCAIKWWEKDGSPNVNLGVSVNVPVGGNVTFTIPFSNGGSIPGDADDDMGEKAFHWTEDRRAFRYHLNDIDWWLD